MGVLSGLPLDEKFGKLQIVREVEPTQHPNGKMKRLVEVVCDCGGDITIKSLTDVKSGKTKSCGLCPKDKPTVDLTGKRTGKLTVIEMTDKRNSNQERIWACLCDCGNTVEVDGLRLRNDRKRNCGVCASPLGTASIGETFKNSEGYEAEIVGFRGKSFLLQVRDSHKAIIEVSSGNARRGNFSNPYHPSVAGVGYFGIGKFIAKLNGKHTTEYADWNSMMKRCYVSKEARTSYKDKEVSEGWKCFQSFAEWATVQPNFGNIGWDLEKDLLVKGNKTYGPDTCVYLPREINSFIKRKRVNDLPLGVDIAYKYNGTPYFRVQGREDGKNINLGSFYNVEEAFITYKVHKEKLANKLAEKWKNKIPDVAYKALLNYTVEVTD